MFIITWKERKSLVSDARTETHKAMTCNKEASFALLISLCKDIRVIEAKIRDDGGDLVPGGFFVQS